MTYFSRIALWSLAPLLGMGAIACHASTSSSQNSQEPIDLQVGSLRTESARIAPGAVTLVKAEIQLGAGNLAIAAGATPLLQANFSYNAAEWKPEVRYTTTDLKGQLLVRQPPNLITSGFSFALPKEFRYEWSLRFGKVVPLDLQIKTGAADSSINLAGVPLKSLDIQAGSGKLDIKLGQQTLEKVRIQAGAGEVNLTVPGGNVAAIAITTGSANVLVDLKGKWLENSTTTIEGTGNVTLIVPTNVSVRLELEGVGTVEATTFKQSGNAWINSLYGRSPVTLLIKSRGIGSVTVK